MLRRLIRWLFKWVFVLLVLIALLAWLANYVFHHSYPLRTKMMAAVTERMHLHHVQPLTDTQIPAGFRAALVATEDRRFAWDPGVDPVGIFRSFLVDVKHNGYIEGGSTITQQLVDNTLLNQQKTLQRKVEQFGLAIGIYDTFSKRETFVMYTNVVYFGHGAYGLYNAAETYFGRTPTQCNAGELAMLAGLPNAPSAYDPFHSLKLARARQQLVVNNMVDEGQITRAQANEILALPIRLRLHQ